MLFRSDEGLRETYVTARRTPGGTASLATEDGPVSTPALAHYLAEAGVTLATGWKADINLRAADWIADVVDRLERGFIVLFDYGHAADELFSARHAGGTIMAFSRHQAAGSEGPQDDRPAWLDRPGEQDLTAHVDFSTVQRVAEIGRAHV